MVTDPNAFHPEQRNGSILVFPGGAGRTAPWFAAMGLGEVSGADGHTGAPLINSLRPATALVVAAPYAPLLLEEGAALLAGAGLTIGTCGAWSQLHRASFTT